MKVLLFANTAWYLYNFRLSLAQALTELGHEVILLSPGEDPYQRLLKNSGYRCLALPMLRRSTNPFSEIKTVWQILQIYKREHPDIVHHFTIKPVLYGSWVARMLGIKKIINAVPGLGYVFTTESTKAKLLRIVATILYRFALRKTRVIFQNPDDMARFVKDKLVQPEQATLIRGSGVDVNTFIPTEECQNTPLVVLPARMLWEKGIREFVEAARRLKSNGIQARFALIGAPDPGNPSSIPTDVLQAWHQEGIVEWWGWREDMLSIYHEANIVCLPTRYGEGAPKTLIEAAACERAIIATDVPGCREVIKNEYNGLLISLDDPDALTNALRNLIENPNERHRMGENGRRLVVAEFSADQVIAETLAVYTNFGLHSQPLQI